MDVAHRVGGSADGSERMWGNSAVPSLNHALAMPFLAAKHRAEAVAGGPARLQVVIVLSSVLALDAADKATVSAVAGSLKQVFHIGNTQIGLLIAITSFIAAVFTLPIGSLVDLTRRNRILLWAVLFWSVAMAVSGFSTSFMFMLGTRMGLGAITAAAFPSIASLTGDFFPARDRARMYGLILGGELVGTGVGFFIGGEVSAWINWRWPFYVMGGFGLLVAWLLWRFLPEPARAGQSWLAEGQEDIPTDAESQQSCGPKEQSSDQVPTGQTQMQVLNAGVKPVPERVLREDPVQHGLWWAIRYVVRIPTYLLLVMASSLAYYFFGGVRGFGMIYLTGHYGVSRGVLTWWILVIGLGALAGVMFGGFLSERLLQRGWFATRVVLPGIAVFLSALLFGVGIWTTNLYIGIAALTAAAACLAAANPSFDAARLDIMHPRLWGRAESGRMLIRAIFEGGAPLLFGAVSVWLGGGNIGLESTFLLMLVPLLIAAALAIPARRTYPRDVATAGASVKATTAKKKTNAG